MNIWFEMLFNFLNMSCLYDEKETNYLKDLQIAKEKFEEKLNKELLAEFKNLFRLFESHMLEIRDKECEDVMHICFKMGMEHEKYFNKKAIEE